MSLTNIHYGTDRGIEGLPEWASYLLFLGFFLSSQTKTDARSVIGVALPTRAYAAALAATGVVYNRTVLLKNRVDIETHFRSLCELPGGTPVTYVHGKRTQPGLLLGSTDQFGEKRLIVQTRGPKSGTETHYVRAADAEKVQPATGPEQTSAPGGLSSRRQTGQLVTPVSEFARNILGEENAKDLPHRSRLECCIIGQLGHLRTEINETEFVADSGATQVQATHPGRFGTLQDILRVRKFMGEGRAYRSEVIASQSSNVPALAGEAEPHVTIFDGTAGFTKWRDYWRQSHWLVLLDRTEPGFEEGARALNTEFITNRVGDTESGGVPLPPAGVELVLYRERLS